MSPHIYVFSKYFFIFLVSIIVQRAFLSRKVRHRSVEFIESGTNAKRYNVVFYTGFNITLETKSFKGIAKLDSSGLRIDGDQCHIEIVADSIGNASLDSVPGGGHIVRIEHSRGILFVGVREFMVGQFVSFNSRETRDLLDGILLLAERNSRGTGCNPA